MNIVHICLSSSVTDGWNYQENLLTKYQKRSGHEVTIITSRWMHNDAGGLVMDQRSHYVNDDGVIMIRLDMNGKEDCKRKLKTFRGLANELDMLKPNIIFIHNVCSQDNTVLVKYLKMHPDVIAYADSHADFSNSATNWVSKNILHKIIWRHYAQMLVPYVKKFYGVLPARVDFLKEVYGLPEDKCQLLVLGADDDAVIAAARPEIAQKVRIKHNIQKDDFLIVTGGKIDIWKTQTLLLMEAVRNIDNPKVKLIVFGSVVPELREQVDELTDGKRIQYIGWIQSKESYQYFAASDLVIFPGRHSVFWEQVVAQGIPMICKDWPGTRHIDLGGNVRFLKEDSEKEIREEINRILSMPNEYSHMKKVAAEAGMKTFSYKDIAMQSIGLVGE